MSALSTLAQHVTRRPQRISLLAQISELGSITRAAKAVGISYKGAWDAIDELNNLAERPLVERSVGGKGGGGARLTAEGERLLALYRRLEALQAQVLQAAEDAEDLNLIGRLMLRTSARNQLHGRGDLGEERPARVTVVQRDHAQAPLDQAGDERFRPVDQLQPQADDEDDRRRGFRTVAAIAEATLAR